MVVLRKPVSTRTFVFDIVYMMFCLLNTTGGGGLPFSSVFLLSPPPRFFFGFNFNLKNFTNLKKLFSLWWSPKKKN